MKKLPTAFLFTCAPTWSYIRMLKRVGSVLIYSFCSYLLARSTQHSIVMAIRVASVIGFSVCLFSVIFFLILYITNFLILLQYNIRVPYPNCNVSDPEFAPGVNLRRHDTLIRTVMNVMTIFF